MGRFCTGLLVGLALLVLWGCAETVWVHPDGRPLRGTVLFVNNVPRTLLVVIPRMGYQFELYPREQRMIELTVRPGVTHHKFTVVMEGTLDSQEGTVFPGQKVEIYMIRAENADDKPTVYVDGEWHRWGIRIWR